MSQFKDFIGYLYRHNLVRYLLVGGSTFLIDFGLLVLLHGRFNVNITLATTIAYWSSVSYNFTLNRNWTFSARENKKLHQHIAAYGILLGCNYLFTVLFVSIASQTIDYTIAKPLSVIIQTAWTYRIYKTIIFSGTDTVTSSSD